MPPFERTCYLVVVADNPIHYVVECRLSTVFHLSAVFSRRAALRLHSNHERNIPFSTHQLR